MTMITRRVIVWIVVIQLLIADFVLSIVNKGFFFYGMGFLVLFIITFTFMIIRKASRRSVWRRTRELSYWAQSKGLRCRSAKDAALGKSYGFSIFNDLNSMHSYYAYNIIEGAVSNRQICVFDYLHADEHCLTAVIVTTDLSLKPLIIRPGNSLDKSVGLIDIEFESTEFNKQFYVTSPDRRWAYDVLQQETMEFLLRSPRFNLEFYGKHLLAYSFTALAEEDVEEALQLLTGILDRLPASVVQEPEATSDHCPNYRDQSPDAHGLGHNYSASTTPVTETLVNLGARVDGQAQAGKSKMVSVLLAVFLAFWTWLYTYRKDKWKFWAGLGLSILVSLFVLATLGIGVIFIWPAYIGIWIWAIVDVTVKKDKWYSSY